MAKLKKTASLALAAVLTSNCMGTAAENAKGSDQTKLLFLRASNREKWKTAGPKSRRALIFKNHIEQAEELLKEPIPQPTASLFMEFVRIGNRANYEKVYFARRKNLVTLVIAECAEYKGRFLDRIADYLWEITAEHTWCLPAHIPAKYNDGLPELPYEIVDLFTAETGMDLALTLNLLEDELKKVSPHLVAEVRRQLVRHIIEPVEVKPFPFWWLKSTNNWRPWCCTNVLIVALTVLNDQPERQRKLVAMLKDAVDDFVKIYAEDGFCDEGPGYWGASVAQVLHFYELLGIPMNQPKHVTMTEYILHIRMGRKYLVNFADGHAKGNPPGTICYRFGEIMNNEDLRQIGLYAGQQPQSLAIRQEMLGTLANIFWLPDLTTPRVKEPEIKDECVYFDFRQVLCLRDRGMALAAKRGFRGSHYHMDIGQFMIFRNDEPVVVDPGIGVYDKSTFGVDRYKNWLINCDGHNVPQFNGVAQLDQPKRDADAVKVTRNDSRCVMEMDLTSAYLPEAKLVSARRTITYDYGDQSVETADAWELSRSRNTVRIPLYTPHRVKTADGGLILGSMRLEITGDPHEIKVENLPISDPHLRRDWGENLTRITITVKSGKRGGCRMRFAPLKNGKAAKAK